MSIINPADLEKLIAAGGFSDGEAAKMREANQPSGDEPARGNGAAREDRSSLGDL